ncbi:hypothetical protein PC116_g28465 [Phytophthora cactorum]|nr:hypothetical protein PC112_g23926 [Phytophthora cactorum]KAG4223063.1 hypothetical protein PC116_g28465 [Phytophthora cactorum]
MSTSQQDLKTNGDGETADKTIILADSASPMDAESALNASLHAAATSSQCPSDCGHFEFGGAARLCKKLTCRQLWCPEASPPMVGHKPPLDSGAPRLQTKMVSSETGDDECKVADGRLVPVLLVSALISASGVELAVRALACSPA